MLSLLLTVTVVAAVSAWLQYAGSEFFAAVLLMLVLVAPPVALGAFALYCRGHRRTFFLGAAAASLGPLLTIGATTPGRLASVVALGVLQAVACGFCGWLALAVRRFVERSGWDRQSDDGAP